MARYRRYSRVLHVGPHNRSRERRLLRVRTDEHHGPGKSGPSGDKSAGVVSIAIYAAAGTIGTNLSTSFNSVATKL